MAFEVPEGTANARGGAVVYDLEPEQVILFDDMTLKKAEVAP